LYGEYEGGGGYAAPEGVRFEYRRLLEDKTGTQTRILVCAGEEGLLD